jgi:hypothetical protein
VLGSDSMSASTYVRCPDPFNFEEVVITPGNPCAFADAFPMASMIVSRCCGLCNHRDEKR